MKKQQSNQPFYSKQVSKEFLQQIAVLIAEKLEENIREKMRGDVEIIVHIDVIDDWPYTFEVTVEAKSKIMDEHKLKEIIEKALDEELEKIAEHMEERGFKLLP